MPNRLAAASSPYLLQHATNPVDWWPWCDEAFEEARRRDVPVFLSIGYSTCYWCHVMERESFQDAAVAAQLREGYVAIKLDREERPDIDEMYMAATISMTGSGGWPMSVFLEPTTRKPFYCGTYFPPQDSPRYGRTSFPQVLTALSNAWRTQRAGVAEQAEQVAAGVAEHLALPPVQRNISREQVADALSQLLQRYDRQNGGFGAAPKFPQPVYLDFLLDVRAAAADETTGTAIDGALKGTLDAMMIGGIYDHLRGGFHRYSVDATWTVPHFEKMLYDNALLASVYARAARLYTDPNYARVALETCTYILEEMTDPATGLFYSAQDAAVDHREGLNYLWSAPHIRQLIQSGDLSQDDGDFVITLFSLDKPANFIDPHHPPSPGDVPLHILRLWELPQRAGASNGLTPAAFSERFSRIRPVMLRARMQRKQPLLDDKSIASWNGLMIAALATASIHLDNAPHLLTAAERAARAAATLLMVEDGTLLRSRRGESTGPAGTLEDYAALANGYTMVHRAVSARDSGNDGYYITLAERLIERAYVLFSVGDGRLVDSAAPDLFIKPTLTHDGATPSGTSLMLHALLGLYECTGDMRWLRRAMSLLGAISGAIHASPLSTINSTRALFQALIISDDAAETLSRVAASGDSATPADVSNPQSLEAADPVEIYSEVERIALSAAHPAAVITVLIKIAPGWHVSAPQATDAPLRVHTVSGPGVNVFCDYPQPTTFAAPGQSPILVYEGSVELRLVVERQETASARHRPLLAVTFQACADTYCQAPRTVELDIAIDIT